MTIPFNQSLYMPAERNAGWLLTSILKGEVRQGARQAPQQQKVS
jgi:hypothetical protein